MNIKKTVIIFYVLFLLFVTLHTAFADEFGCCSNAGAGLLTCTTERLVLKDRECCPTPESGFPSYYKSQQNPFGPANYNKCTTNFFFPNKDCGTVDACALGCCCSELGGTIKSEATCKATNLTFYKGITDCNEVCATPECSDGIDNDDNGCADFAGGDLGCNSVADTDESGGTCIPEGIGCSDPGYSPKLSNLIITPIKGMPKFFLRWQDECTAESYTLLRCKGSSCTNFIEVGTANANSFTDASEDLLFDTTYTYQVKAAYSLQKATPTITKTATLGSKECLGRLDTNVFCLNSTAYFCDQYNNLVPEGTKCSPSQYCIAEASKAKCVSKINCNYNSANPFGLYYTLNGCEANRYCFYDKSYTNVNSCFSCDPSMACYDYKTKEACSRDNCKVGNCQWKSLADQIGVGACVSTAEYNCEWCDKKGTETLENTRSYNEIFDFCTQEKSDLLSEGSFKCYYKNGKSNSCNEVVCTDYNTDQCSNTKILHDEFNRITNPSSDKCGIKVCQNIGGACVKNADGDDLADCSNSICEADYFAPDATMLPTIRKGIFDDLIIQIYDRTSANSSTILKTSSDYDIFLCVEPCSQQGHPYNALTKSRRIIISNLNAYDGSNGSKLLSFSNGINVIRYYSQDPAKNIEEVKRLTVEAYSNTTGPKIFAVNVTGGAKVLDKIYTNNQKPTIDVQFVEPAIVTFARLIDKKTNYVVTLQGNTELSTKVSFSITQPLPNAEYAFELNAKNQNNIFMDPPFSAIIVVDNVKPTLSIVPSEGAVINASNVAITLTFNKEVNLEEVKINSEDIKSSFATTDNKIFALTITLDDGNKKLEVAASDFANNKVIKSSLFVVDAYSTTISLVKPKFGVLSKFTFDIVAATDNNADCRYSLDSNFEFDFMEPFTTTGGTNHIISNFDEIANGDTSTHKLHVKCQDRHGIAYNSFDINVDATPPQLKTAFAYPNPVIEKPSTTTLTVEADEPAICKFSKISNKFDTMEGKFGGFDNNTFQIINKQPITVEGEGTFEYFVACRNKAELISEPKTIAFSVNLSIPILITPHTPEFFNSTSISLAIETSKKAQCQYSETDPTARSGELFGAPSFSHTKQLVSAQGKHTFFVVCKDQYLQRFSNVATIDFTVDTTPPSMLFVDDTSTFRLFPEKTCLTDRLRVKFLGEDIESRVKEYFYSLNKKISNATILGFVQTFTGGEWIWVENLDLNDNTEYFFKAKAKNYVNLESDPKNSDGITVNTSACAPEPSCGDGRLDPGELCDPDQGIITFGPIKKCTDYINFIGGNLKCSYTTCLPDTTDCIAQPYCGDKIIQKGEHCDDGTLGIIDTCTELGFASGPVSCTSNCFLDTSKCVPKQKCGNSIIDSREECDGTNLGPLNGQCTQYSPLFTGGTLRCSNNCKLDTSGCLGVIGTCGNGVINIGEKCDGTAFGLIKTCIDYSPDFIGGNLSCKNCDLDTSKCIPQQACGNSIIDSREECDGTNLGPLNGQCTQYSPYFSGGTLRCNSECKLDTFNCIEAPVCGNGVIDGDEQCDENNFGKLAGTCANYSKDFISGNLKCSDDCNILTSDCIKSNVCGNGIIDSGETCDGNNFGIFSGTCINYSKNLYIGGNLLCSNCQINTLQCQVPPQPPVCGDGVVNQLNESCDKQDLNGYSCQTFGFQNGNLKCTDNCRFDKTGCSSPGPKICGDGTIDKPNTGNQFEQCDKTNLDNKQCTDIDDYTGGQLGCYEDKCLFDTSKCTKTSPVCGDGRISPGEQCDITNLDNKNCKDFGYLGGDLSCNNCKFDFSKCTLPPPCGNGRIDTGELCDDKGPVYGSISSCTHFNNFIGGTLGCNNCQIDTTKCVRRPYCGDKTINSGESCDDGQFGAVKSCMDLGFASGPVSCTPACFYDTTKCVPKPKCSNDVIDSGEECDGTNLGPLNGQCTQYSPLFTGGTLRCSNNCKLDTSSCFGVTGTCGDGIINIGEKCDGTAFGLIKTCTDYSQAFIGGTLSCSNCQLDTSKCIEGLKCGNGIIDQGEECDGSNLGLLNTSCASYGSFFKSGTIKCGSDCKLDTTGCQESPKCGNGAIDPDETCDGYNFGNFTDLSCSSYSSSFINGTLVCSIRSCQISTDNCRTNAAIINITCKDRGDCKIDEPCNDNSDCESRFCSNGKCSQSSCNDGVKNQNEADIDCSGSCSKCQNGKTCNLNSDCQSNFCGFGFCKPQESCSDGRLSPGESDIDCGGPCPAKCLEGKSCDSNSDCEGSLECTSSICKKIGVVRPSLDTDGDGMPDDWEIQNGLDPNDPNDAELDNDNDGLTNKQEYETQNTYGRSTDPNKEDTDGDGVSDKIEIDKGTNPLDPKDFPKSSLTKIIMYLTGIAVLLSGFGYLAYTALTRKKEEKFEPRLRLEREAPPQQRQAIMSRRGQEAITREALRRREEQKLAERKKLFEAFGREGKEKPKEELKEAKAEKPELKEIRMEKKPHGKKAKRASKAIPKKTKEDVFKKLKEIAREGKKKKARKNAAK